jgi:hypothetical protein
VIKLISLKVILVTETSNFKSKMKRLEDIPKKQSFKVPDGYFDDLPMRIQARIQETEKERSWSWMPAPSFALKFALPVILIGIISVVFWNKLSTNEDAFAKLDSVPTEQLLAYLESDEITTEEIIENGTFTSSTINTLYEQNEELPTEELDELAKQYDFNF